MISSATEYLNMLYRIQTDTNRSTVILLPSDEPMLNIDLESRLIETPNFISVESDNRAETMLFCVDRFYGNMDLALQTIIIQYVNAEGTARIYPVDLIDVTTMRSESKILFPWQIGNEAVAVPGKLTFSVQFYSVDNISHKYTYCLNTQPATTEVLPGLEGFNDAVATEQYDAQTLQRIYDAIQKLQASHQVYWSYASQLGVNEDGTPSVEIRDYPITFIDGTNSTGIIPDI